MPWDVKHDDRCPSSKPWAVIKQGSGELEGCHPSEDAAHKQQAALYANEPRSLTWALAHNEQFSTTLTLSEETGDHMAKTEKRFAIDAWQTGDWQIRAEDDGMTFTGYAAVFNSDSDGPIPGFGIEQIAPGAFTKSLRAKRDIKMFLNHNADLVLASREAETLELAEDDTGLLATARFIDTTVGSDTAKNVKAGNVRHMSFGFNPVRTKTRTDGTTGTIHTDVQLWEVSPVTAWPAYRGTSAFVRHLAEAAGEDPDALSEVLTQLDALAEQRIAGETEAAFSDEQYDLAIRVINVFRGSRLELAPPLRSRWEQRIAQLPQ